MSSSPADPSQHGGSSNDALSIQKIIDLISKAKASVSSPGSSNNKNGDIDNNGNNGNSGSNGSDGRNSNNGGSNNKNVVADGNNGSDDNNSTNGGGNSGNGGNDSNNGGNAREAKEEENNDSNGAGNDGSGGSCWSTGFFKADKDSENINDDQSGNGNSSDQVSLRFRSQLEKLVRDLVFIKEAFTKLKNFEHSVGVQFETLQRQGQNLEKICGSITQEGQAPDDTLLTKQVQSNIRLLSEVVLKLKLQIQSPQKLSSANSDDRQSETGNDISARKVVGELLKIDDKEKFQSKSAFKDFQESFEKLNIRSKVCLLCFAVFPENAVVNKRLLTYWWVGEAFVDPPVDEEKTAEEIAEGILKEFLAKGFIDPVIKKRRLVGFRMHPVNRYAVVILAEKMGFLHSDSIGNPTAIACLIKTEEGSTRKALLSSDPEKLHTLFNVNDPYPDFELEWFLRMKNVNVLHLGRWQGLAKRHIEVEGTEFLRGFRNMKHLRLLSLQGISRITELPDSIGKLTNLRILDLNACHNLDSIPDTIALLKMLTHLDISECYFLENLPKGIGLLSELQVLKGFVISGLKRRSSCTINDLAKLQKLRKLSIHTSKKNFPEKEELTALHRLGALRKLTIAWAGNEAKSDDSSKQVNVSVNSTEVNTTNPNNSRDCTRQDNDGAQPATNQGVLKKLARLPALKRGTRLTSSELPANLEKLDLQCFPEIKAPSWLMPSKLQCLRKLYIRGGNLQNLGQFQEKDKWTVKILRLKFLGELKMNWRQLQDLFPDLIYLEKFACPKLTFFPCDESGVWLNKTMVSKQLLEEELEFAWSFLTSRST